MTGFFQLPLAAVTNRVRWIALCVLLPAAGCAHTMYDPVHASPAYPSDLHRPTSVDIQVFREGPELEIVNSTPTTYRDVAIWINQRFMRPLDTLPAGATIRLSLWDFWDVRGDRFAAGGFWRVQEPTPLRLVELQVGEDEPLVGLVTIYVR